VAQIIVHKGRVRPHSARQQTAAQRAIAEGGDLVAAAVRQDIGLDSALEKIVRRLDHMQRRLGPEPLDLRDGKIADADRPDLSLLEQRMHDFRGFFQRR